MNRRQFLSSSAVLVGPLSGCATSKADVDESGMQEVNRHSHGYRLNVRIQEIDWKGCDCQLCFKGSVTNDMGTTRELAIKTYVYGPDHNVIATDMGGLGTVREYQTHPFDTCSYYGRIDGNPEAYEIVIIEQ